jgi:hypothetical protein
MVNIISLRINGWHGRMGAGAELKGVILQNKIAG